MEKNDGWSAYMMHESRVRILKNLEQYHNLRKLGFDLNELAKQAENEDRMNIIRHSPPRPFDYNLASVLSNPISIKRAAHYVKIIDYQVGVIIKRYPIFKKNLRRMFMENFAHAGFVTALCEFFIGQGIKIVSIEPVNPNNKKRPDIEILLNGKHVFIEALTPVESLLNAFFRRKNIDVELNKIIGEKLAKGQLIGIDSPTLIAINISDPSWSKNFFWNRGCVTNEMFFCIKNTDLRDGTFSLHDISGLMIKYADRLIVEPRLFSRYPLLQEDLSNLTNIGLSRKVLSSIFRRNL